MANLEALGLLRRASVDEFSMTEEEIANLPKSFDSAKHWPDCKEVSGCIHVLAVLHLLVLSCGRLGLMLCSS